MSTSTPTCTPSQVRGAPLTAAASCPAPPPSVFPGSWGRPSCLLSPARGLFPAATRPPFPSCHRSTQRRAGYAACFETNDEKQCVCFTSLKGGFQRIVTTLFTCQVQGRFPMGPWGVGGGGEEGGRAELGPGPSRPHPGLSASHLSQPGLWPEGIRAASPSPPHMSL